MGTDIDRITAEKVMRGILGEIQSAHRSGLSVDSVVMELSLLNYLKVYGQVMTDAVIMGDFIDSVYGVPITAEPYGVDNDKGYIVLFEGEGYALDCKEANAKRRARKRMSEHPRRVQGALRSSRRREVPSRSISGLKDS